MVDKILRFTFLLIISIAFLSSRFKEKAVGDYNNTLLGFQYSHKGYYDTGELRYICHDHQKGHKGRGTGMIRKFKFKRLYFDKCGNIKLIVKGKGEFGCWRNEIKILKQIMKNENIECQKEPFIYPSEEELEIDLKKE